MFGCVGSSKGPRDNLRSFGLGFGDILKLARGSRIMTGRGPSRVFVTDSPTNEPRRAGIAHAFARNFKDIYSSTRNSGQRAAVNA